MNSLSSSKSSINSLLVSEPWIYAEKASPNEVMAVIKEVEFVNQIFINFASSPFSDQLCKVFVVREKIVSSMFISSS